MNTKKLYGGLFIATFSLLLFLCGVFLLKTNAGTQTMAKLVTHYFPDNISIGSISGKLLGQLEITNLKYRSKEAYVEIENLHAHSRLNLKSFRIDINNLILKNVHLNPHFSTQQSVKRKGYFPFHLTANNILYKNIMIHFNNKKIQLPDMLGSFELSSKLFSLAFYRDPNRKYFNLIRKNNNIDLSLNFPFEKTRWIIHYLNKQNEFNLQGEIFDNANGKIVLSGTGKEHCCINLTAKQFHIDHLFKNYWPGAINFELEINQQPKYVVFLLKHISGNLHNQSLQGNGQLIIENKKATMLLLKLTSGDSMIFIKGEQQKQLHIDWFLKVPKIDLFLPNSKGQISTAGMIEGSPTNPILSGNFFLKDIHFLDYELEKGIGQFSVNTHNNSISDFRIEGSNIKYKKFLLSSLLLNGKGSLNNHDIFLKAKMKDQTANLHLVGNVHAKQWSSNIHELTIKNLHQTWHLQQLSTFKVDNTKLSLTPLYLGTDKNQISLAGDYYFCHMFNGKLRIINLDLSLFDFLLPQNQRLVGTLDLNATANQSKNINDLKINAKLNPGSFYFMFNDEQQMINFKGGKLISLTNRRNELESNIELFFPEGSVNSQLTFPSFSGMQDFNKQKIQGHVNLQISSFSLLQLAIPTISNIKGKLSGDFNLAGTISNPLLKGDLNLTQGYFYVPKLNLQVTNVILNAKSEGNDIFFNGSLMTGKGILQLNGQSRIQNDEFPIDVNLQGKDLLICNTPGIRIFASPNLKLLLKNKQLYLNGNILIPEANLHPNTFENSDNLSDDIIFVNTDGKKDQTNNLRIISNISMTLGNHIYLDSKGIKGQMLGQLRIQDDPSKATIAYGQLKLQNGSYTVYGRTLQIDYGKLNYTGGPINNPGLELRASRTLQTNKSHSLLATQEQLKVGVSVQGTLHSPKINLFSEPAGKTSADILSYLLLGVPVNSVRGTNTTLLLQAADALNANGTYKILNLKSQLKQSLGLSELDIGMQSETDPKTQETLQHTAFILGKYLSPNFYVNYSFDLFDHSNTLKVRYLFNKFWTIQSVANTNRSGIDVLYTIEK